MPELPEVETTLRGLAPHLLGQRIAGVAIRHPHLRWPIPKNLHKLLGGQTSAPSRAAPNIFLSIAVAAR